MGLNVFMGKWHLGSGTRILTTGNEKMKFSKMGM